MTRRYMLRLDEVLVIRRTHRGGVDLVVGGEHLHGALLLLRHVLALAATAAPRGVAARTAAWPTASLRLWLPRGVPAALLRCLLLLLLRLPLPRGGGLLAGRALLLPRSLATLWLLLLLLLPRWLLALARLSRRACRAGVVGRWVAHSTVKDRD